MGCFNPGANRKGAVMNALNQKKCLPCEGIGKVLDNETASKLLVQIPEWKISNDGKSISRDYVKKDFMDAFVFINEVGRIAELENHHPDIHLTGYKNVRIELSTHALKGLSENDFIVAAKINELPRPLIAKR